MVMSGSQNPSPTGIPAAAPGPSTLYHSIHLGSSPTPTQHLFLEMAFLPNLAAL